MERPTPSDMMPKRDHGRDLELDKRIEALRRKNEVLMKRYKEVEEDKKRAEEEGMTPQSRKGKADDLTITISKSTSQESRVVVTKPFSDGSPAGKGQQEAGPDRGEEGPSQVAGRGLRKQLTVTMDGKKGKRVVSERLEKRLGPADAKGPADEGHARRAESAGRGKQPPHTPRRNMAVEDEGQGHAGEHHRLSEQCKEPESLHAGTDLDIPTLREEQQEYTRWKREREQIDKERVARHKNSKGQWRREWDVDKTENMFRDKSLPDREWGPCSRGGRSARRGQPRGNMDPRGPEKRGKEKGNKNVLVMSSKAKGKDRLTGRARRWHADEDGENLEISDTTLEDFLEELDALTDDVEAKDPTGEDAETKPPPGPDLPGTSEEVGGSTAPVVSAGPAREASSSPPRSSEKKVRFSEELIRGAHARRAAGSQDSASSDSGSPRSSPEKNKHEVRGPQQPLALSAEQDGGGPRDQGGGPSAPPVAHQQTSDTECPKQGSNPPTAPNNPPAEKACTSPRDASVQPVELAKCNISNTNTEELIDSGLSVLSLESGETLPTHCTSSDKAREHGKIV